MTRHGMAVAGLLLGSAFAASPALAQADGSDASPAPAEERAYAPSRPGLGTPAGTISPGRVSVEIGVADWERDVQGRQRADTLLLGDTVIRLGVTDSVEIFGGWTAYGRASVRDTATRSVERADGVGDVTLGFKANLAQPDGSGLSFAVQPFVTLPVGRAPIGDSAWSSGVVVPVTYDLNDTINLQVTSEIDAAANGAGGGHHLSYSTTGGISVQMTKNIQITGEFSLQRDEDPDGHATQALAALSLAWSPQRRLQIDTGSVFGLNRNSPDFRLYAGISRLF